VATTPTQSAEASSPPRREAASQPPPAPANHPLVIGIDIRRGGEFGVGTYIKNLVRALARMGGDEEYVLIGRLGQFESLGKLPPNFRSEIYPHPYNASASHFTYWFSLRRLGLDLFHMPHRWVPYLLPGAYVATLHDLNSILFPEEGSSGMGRRWRRYLLSHGLSRAAQVIAVSEATKRDAVKHLGLSPEKIEVVPDAVDSELAQPVTDQERDRTLARYQIHDPFVLYAGRIQIHKNVPRLIEAFGVVKAELENHPRYRNLRLIIIGDELSNFPAVRHAVMRTRIQHWVRFLGFVPLETLRVFYDSAEAFLFPSLHEGFGLAPLEAMAQGTPVVTSSVSALPETVGNAAVLVNPENVFDIARGLRQVLLDDEFREDLRRRGYEQVLRFSWDRSAERVLQIYRRVTSRQGHAS
jgi:glycosyltransferase involved in cell wall biosynthesis